MTEFCDLGRSEEVDGVVYTRPFGPDSVWVRPLLEFLDDHEGGVCATDYPEGFCSECDCAAPCCFSGHMRWKPDTPIIRFTSEGLEYYYLERDESEREERPAPDREPDRSRS